MATLEDKILGDDKITNYCSSSEDEYESLDGEEGASASKISEQQESQMVQGMSHWSGASENTGPKGVINDWQRFKQLENERRGTEERERLELFKKLSITAKTTAEDDRARKEEEEMDPELRELMRDDILVQFQKQRMNEMLTAVSKSSIFKQVFNLETGDDFLNAVDKEIKTATIVIHIYENNVKACRTMNQCLETLAEEYPNVKFCRMLSTCAGMSINFKKGGIPALLVYKGGEMIGNFVRLSDEFGDDFFSTDVESFLIEHAMISAN